MIILQHEVSLIEMLIGKFKACKQRAVLLVSRTFCPPALRIGVGRCSGRSRLSCASVRAVSKGFPCKHYIGKSDATR